MRAPRISWVALAGVVALCLPREAHAYLDPTTGSMLISALISIFVTAGFALQSYGYRLLAFFRGARPEEPSAQDERKLGAQRDAAERGAESGAPPRQRDAQSAP
jgi:hypothetical protein